MVYLAMDLKPFSAGLMFVDLVFMWEVKLVTYLKSGKSIDLTEHKANK